MRLFTEKENELLKKMVEYKQAGNLKELQVAPLLRKNLSFLALTWSVSPVPFIKVYTTGNGKQNFLKEYLEIVDFVCFVQELAKQGFVKLLIISNENKERVRQLYDKEKYEFIENKNQFLEKGIDKKHGILSLFGDFEYNLLGKTDTGEYIEPVAAQQVPNDFANDLENVVYKIIYPLPIMEDYVSNGFRTIADRRYEENRDSALKANKYSRRAVLLSALSCLIALFIGMAQTYISLYKPSELSDTQFERFDTLLKNNAITEPIKVEMNDTLKVFPVSTKSNKK